MDADEELPALVPLDNAREDPIPALIPIVERQPFLLPPRAHDFTDDLHHMSSLMSISDSSDDADVSSYHYSSGGDDGDESEWTDDDESNENVHEDLPSLPPSHQDAVQTDEESEEDLPSPEYPVLSSDILPFPFFNDNLWLRPYRRNRGTGMVNEALLEAITLRMNPGVPEEPIALPESDQDRATVLVDGLECVSGGLLERLLRVGGAPGAYEDVSKENKGVSGCAICWESLLGHNIWNDALPFPPENDNDREIVCLPCAHVFHSACLIPWFSQKTSCPTCRFNIDPDSLTQRPLVQSQQQDDNEEQTTSIHSLNIHRENHISTSIYDHGTIDGIETSLDNLSESEYEFDNDGSLFDDFTPNGTHLVNPWGSPTQSTHANRPWTLPDAPGKSLRETIEEKEREMGLRCLAPICIFAPTDEAPHAAASIILRQISIKAATVTTCVHTVHPACLVRSARVAGWKPAASNTVDLCDNDFSAAEVLCPCCRTSGTVSRMDWEDGATALAKNGP